MSVAVFSETDSGLAAARGETERLCLATRDVKAVDGMIRLVGAPDGRVVADIERKLPGRGAWITATRTAVEKALADKVLARAFKGKYSAAPDLPDEIETLLEKAALASLSMANKAGVVITGFTKIEKALAEVDVFLLVHASDAAPDGIRKLQQASARSEMAGLKHPDRIAPFRGEQLDLALGRSNVVHAALLTHPVSTAFLSRCLRLDRWRNGGQDGGKTGV
jgi:uncharacterized protein